MFLSKLDPMIIVSTGHNLCLLTQLTFQLNPCLIEIKQLLESWVNSSYIWAPYSWWERRVDEGINSKTRSERWCSSSELFYKPLRNGNTLSTPPPPSWGKTTSASEKGSNLHRCSQSSGHWVEEIPWREYLHLGRENKRSLEGYRGCWCIFSLQPCMAPMSHVGIE